MHRLIHNQACSGTGKLKVEESNMRTLLMIFTILCTMTKQINSCCCTSGSAKSLYFGGEVGVLGVIFGVTFDTCGCNIFNCNCDTDKDGYCQYALKKKCTDPKMKKKNPTACESTSGCSRKPFDHLPWHFAEKACDRRRRRKSQEYDEVYEKYHKMYPELVGNPALGVFALYDRNGDGAISLTEFNTTIKSNNLYQIIPLHAFKQVDLNQDDQIHPFEFDRGLK